MTKNEQIAALREVQVDDYFAADRWSHRGVNASPAEIQRQLKNVVRRFVDRILAADLDRAKEITFRHVAPAFAEVEKLIEYHDTEDREMVLEAVEDIARKISAAVYDPYPNRAVLECPSCSGKLRLPIMPSRIAATCPRCAHGFTVQDGIVQE